MQTLTTLSFRLRNLILPNQCPNLPIRKLRQSSDVRLLSHGWFSPEKPLAQAKHQKCRIRLRVNEKYHIGLPAIKLTNRVLGSQIINVRSGSISA
jgi:hypothetical protein